MDSWLCSTKREGLVLNDGIFLLLVEYAAFADALGNFPSPDDKLDAQSEAVMMSSKGKFPSEGPVSFPPLTSSLSGKTMSLGQWVGQAAQTHPQQTDSKAAPPHTYSLHVPTLGQWHALDLRRVHIAAVPGAVHHIWAGQYAHVVITLLGLYIYAPHADTESPLRHREYKQTRPLATPLQQPATTTRLGLVPSVRP